MKKQIFWNKEIKKNFIGFCYFAFFAIAIISLIFFALFAVVNYPGDVADFFKGFTISRIFNQKNILTQILITFIVTLLYFLSTYLLCFYWSTKNKGKYVTDSNQDDYGGAKWLIDDQLVIKTNPPIIKNGKPVPVPADMVKMQNKVVMAEFEKFYPNSKNYPGPGWVARSRYNPKTKKTAFWVKPDTQSITIGATGSGKTQKDIIPTAIRNSRLDFNNKPCMVFTDPKQELFDELSGPLQSEGYEVLLLNLRSPMNSSGWNPLQIIYNFFIKYLTVEKDHFTEWTCEDESTFNAKWKTTTCLTHELVSCVDCKNKTIEEKDEEDLDYYKIYFINTVDGTFVLENSNDKETQIKILKNEYKTQAFNRVEELATSILPVGTGDSAMWNSLGQKLITAVIYSMLEILEHSPEQMPVEKFNMVNVASNLSKIQDVSKFFKEYEKKHPFMQSVLAGSEAYNSPEKTLGSISSNLSQATKIFLDYSLRSLLCQNTIDLFNLTDKPRALFLVIPDDEKSKHVLASLFISQLYQASVYTANQQTGKKTLPRQLMFYLDEFGNMPKIPNFDSIITVARSRNIFVKIIVQDYAQMTAVYGKEGANTIISNCNFNLYIQTNSDETAEQYSRDIGDRTVVTKSINTGANTSKGEKIEGSGSLTGLRLIKGSDLRRLPDPIGIAMYPKTDPGKVFLELAYRCTDFNLGKAKKIASKIKLIDFEKDVAFYLSNFKDYANWNMEEKKVFSSNLGVKGLSLAEKKKLAFDETVELDDFSISDEEMQEAFEGFEKYVSESKESMSQLSGKEISLRRELSVRRKASSLMSTEEKKEYNKFWRELLSILDKKRSLRN